MPIFGEEVSVGLKEVCEGRSDVYNITLDKIRIVKGRNIRFEDFGDLHMLAFQLMSEGQLEPCIGRYVKNSDDFEITDGERRFRAAQIARKQGWPTTYLKCTTEAKDTTDDKRIITMLHANESKPITTTERAKAYQRLTEAGWSTKDISKSMGCTKSSVEEFLALLEAPKEIQEAVSTGKMSATAGKKAATATKEKQAEIVEKVKRGEKISVKDTQEKRTQFSITEIKDCMESTCHSCPMKKDLISTLEAL